MKERQKCLELWQHGKMQCLLVQELSFKTQSSQKEERGAGQGEQRLAQPELREPDCQSSDLFPADQSSWGVNLHSISQHEHHTDLREKHEKP